MTHPFDKNIMTTLAGLNLALSYENAVVDRLDKRLSESIDPEVKEKLSRHLAQTRDQQDLLKDYERSLPLRFSSMKCKGFCCYHQADFRLSEDQKEQLFEHHYMNLIVTK